MSHMPPKFTKSLNGIKFHIKHKVKEAEEGDILLGGHAYVHRRLPF